MGCAPAPRPPDNDRCNQSPEALEDERGHDPDQHPVLRVHETTLPFIFGHEVLPIRDNTAAYQGLEGAHLPDRCGHLAAKRG